jgi:predicted GNAT superfamily acetyltransferase
MQIRPIERRELHAVEALQREVWHCSDLETVPGLHLIPAVAVGAILLGAFEGDELMGFVYGFPGFRGEERIIHSDMLAVRESHRNRGLGRALKLAQREHALTKGIRTITWTFDPLQAKNAYLNFAILGATADQYLRDFYGQTTSPLHRFGTDRLWVTWNLDGAQENTAMFEIEAPEDVNMLTIDEALGWREKTRRQFEDAFSRDLIVTGFDARRSMYTLATK